MLQLRKVFRWKVLRAVALLRACKKVSKRQNRKDKQVFIIGSTIRFTLVVTSVGKSF